MVKKYNIYLNKNNNTNLYLSLNIIYFLKKQNIHIFFKKYSYIFNLNELSKKNILWFLLFEFKSIIMKTKLQKINLFFINNFIVNDNNYNKISNKFNKDFYILIINYFVGIISINYKF